MIFYALLSLTSSTACKAREVESRQVDRVAAIPSALQTLLYQTGDTVLVKATSSITYIPVFFGPVGELACMEAPVSSPCHK